MNLKTILVEVISVDFTSRLYLLFSPSFCFSLSINRLLIETTFMISQRNKNKNPKFKKYYPGAKVPSLFLYFFKTRN